MKAIWTPPKGEMILLHSKSDLIALVNKMGFTSPDYLESRGIYLVPNSYSYTEVTSKFPVWAAANGIDEDLWLMNSNIKGGMKVINISEEDMVSLHSKYSFPCVLYLWDEVSRGRVGTSTINLWEVSPLSEMKTVEKLNVAEDKHFDKAQVLLDGAMEAQFKVKKDRQAKELNDISMEMNFEFQKVGYNESRWSLDAASAICDFLEGKENSQEVKSKVKEYIQSIDINNREELVVSKLDELFFGGEFASFVEGAGHDIIPQFTPNKRVFTQMIK